MFARPLCRGVAIGTTARRRCRRVGTIALPLTMVAAAVESKPDSLAAALQKRQGGCKIPTFLPPVTKLALQKRRDKAFSAPV